MDVHGVQILALLQLKMGISPFSSERGRMDVHTYIRTSGYIVKLKETAIQQFMSTS